MADLCKIMKISTRAAAKIQNIERLCGRKSPKRPIILADIVIPGALPEGRGIGVVMIQRDVSISVSCSGGKVSGIQCCPGNYPVEAR